MTAAELGCFGATIAQRFWPTLQLVPSGTAADLNGTDAYDGTIKIQIKTDREISENVFHEIWKRNGVGADYWASHGSQSDTWRRSPCDAGAYIFVGKEIAIRATVDILARAERNLTLRQINPTAMGFLIAIDRLAALGAELQFHSEFWRAHVD